ncbi:MAG: DUF2794 domain-containing protein [Bdellovibrionales bacterium]
MTFSRAELGLILAVYARRVAAGEWRDYAIDHIAGLAVFSVFQHTREQPCYSIVKFRQPGDRRSFEYAVFQRQALLRRSADLENALRVLKLKLVVKD